LVISFVGSGIFAPVISFWYKQIGRLATHS
jgi:hypothetical protein